MGHASINKGWLVNSIKRMAALDVEIIRFRRLILPVSKYTSIAFIILLLVACVSHGQSSVPNDTVITLHRLADGFADSPAYNLTIKADGTVTFKQFAKRLIPPSDPRAHDSEVIQSRVPVETVAALVAAFERAKFFSLKDRYAENEDGCPAVTYDFPAAEISITSNGKSKTIFHYYGCRDQNRETYPAELYALATKIDELVNTKQWLK